MSIEFSVLMAVWAGDQPGPFRAALQSVFVNTLQPKEVIVVCDGPIPESLRTVLDSFAYIPHLRVKSLPKNLGLAGALNVGIKECACDWVVRADADDINNVERFSILAQEMDGSHDIIGSFITEIDEHGKPTAVRKTPETHEDIVRFVRYRNPFNHMSVCFRREFVQRIGSYPDIFLREDYALWAVAISSGARCRNIPRSLVTCSAGMPMIRRRGGWRYALAEVVLQRLLVRRGLKGPLSAVVHGTFRVLAFLAPSLVRAAIYRVRLRTAVEQA